MCKTLVIPDVHLKISKVCSILESIDHDKVIFLGDFFDNYNAKLHFTESTAKWLKDNLPNPRYIFLLGNHDAHYRWPYQGFCCSGWTKEQCDCIQGILDESDWEHFQVLTEEQGYVLSHAGIHPQIFGNPATGKVDIESVKEQCLLAVELAKTRKIAPPFHCGTARGGNKRLGEPDSPGGIIWADWYKEFVPIEGIKQIVGHTFTESPANKDGNWNIDTALKHMGKIEDGSFGIIKIKEG